MDAGAAPPVASAGPGARLRAAREAAGLSLDQVAQQLKLASAFDWHSPMQRPIDFPPSRAPYQQHRRNTADPYPRKYFGQQHSKVLGEALRVHRVSWQT